MATAIGYVIDDITKEPLTGAHVYVMREGVPYGTTTDNNGAWMLDGVAFGEEITVSFVGYAPQKFLFQGGGVQVRLAPGVDLPEVEITPDAPGTGALAIAGAAALFLLAMTGEDKPTQW